MIGNHIKHYRQLIDLTQQDLANLCGVARETIVRIENNKNLPNIELALKISYYLQIDIYELFYIDNNCVALH